MRRRIDFLQTHNPRRCPGSETRQIENRCDLGGRRSDSRHETIVRNGLVNLRDGQDEPWTEGLVRNALCATVQICGFICAGKPESLDNPQQQIRTPSRPLPGLTTRHRFGIQRYIARAIRGIAAFFGPVAWAEHSLDNAVASGRIC